MEASFRQQLHENKELQDIECQALFSIFPREIAVADAYPLCLRVLVSQESIDCKVELGFRFPPLFPLSEAVIVRVYIPPPFRAITETCYAELQKRLSKKAEELVGQEGGIVFSLIHLTTEWMEENLELLQSAKNLGMHNKVLEELMSSKSSDIAGKRKKSGKKQPKDGDTKTKQSTTTTATSSSSSSSTSTSSSSSTSTASTTTTARKSNKVHKQHKKKKGKKKTAVQAIQLGHRDGASDVSVILHPGKIKDKVMDLLGAVRRYHHISEAKAKALLLSNGWNLEAALATPRADQWWDETPQSDEKSKDKKQNSEEVALPVVALPLPLIRTESVVLAQDLAHVTRLYRLIWPSTGPSPATDSTALQAPTFTCLVCFDTQPVTDGACMGCLHWLCWDCWPAYLENKIQEGDAALRCPGQNCPRPVEEPFLLSVLSDESAYAKYRRWVYNSYVKITDRLQYCPNSGCEHVVEVPSSASVANGAHVDTSVFCECGHVWCFLCKQEAHFPISCKTRTEYMQSELVQSARKELLPQRLVAEIVEKSDASTKQCPRCKEPWWKNGGCNHFTCPCGHQFCWICLGDWKNHSGDFYNCMEKTKTHEQKQMEVEIVVGREVIHIQTNRDRSLVMRLRQYCQSEAGHSEMEARLKSLLSSAAKLRELSEKLDGCDPLFVYETAWTQQQAHARIRYSYVYFYLYHDLVNAKEGQDDRIREICRTFALSFLSYTALVDSLDRSIVPTLTDKIFVRNKEQVIQMRERISQFGRTYYSNLLDFSKEVVTCQQDRELINYFQKFEEDLALETSKKKEEMEKLGIRVFTQ
eukprot:gb/GEZN01002345.1/.p1 GENE.gb/GEZN01002345.1/~~gb/GEZN01002345.1/.p1  ORF type:complete len:837 (-),score=131.25 gb/GEZN01002345.1/:10-2448(-)